MDFNGSGITGSGYSAGLFSDMPVGFGMSLIIKDSSIKVYAALT